VIFVHICSDTSDNNKLLIHLQRPGKTPS